MTVSKVKGARSKCDELELPNDVLANFLLVHITRCLLEGLDKVLLQLAGHVEHEASEGILLDRSIFVLFDDVWLKVEVLAVFGIAESCDEQGDFTFI